MRPGQFQPRTAGLSRKARLNGNERNTASRGPVFPAAESPVSVPAKIAARKTSSSGKLTPPAPGGFTEKVRLQCRTRAGNGNPWQARCECCACWLGLHGGQIQHRLARGSGGSRDPIVNGLSNAALLCGTSVTPSCHGAAESRDPKHQMKVKGFVIDHGKGPEFDPRYVPIRLQSQFGSGMSVYLAADGIGDDGNGYLFASPLVGTSIAAIAADDAAGLAPSLRTRGNQ
jgi:hypothetical protein